MANLKGKIVVMGDVHGDFSYGLYLHRPVRVEIGVVSIGCEGFQINRTLGVSQFPFRPVELHPVYQWTVDGETGVYFWRFYRTE